MQQRCFLVPRLLVVAIGLVVLLLLLEGNGVLDDSLNAGLRDDVSRLVRVIDLVSVSHFDQELLGS